MDEPDGQGATPDVTVEPAAAAEPEQLEKEVGSDGQADQPPPAGQADSGTEQTPEVAQEQPPEVAQEQPPEVAQDLPESEKPATEDIPAGQSAEGAAGQSAEGAAGQSAEGEGTAPTPAAPDAQDQGVTDVTNRESMLGKKDVEPTGEEKEVGAVAAEEVKAEVAASQEPGAVPAEDASGESAAKGPSEEGGPPDTLDAAPGQQDSVGVKDAAGTTEEQTEKAGSQDTMEAKTTTQGEEEGQKTGTEEGEVVPGAASAQEAISENAGSTDAENTTDQTTEQSSAVEKSDTDTAVEGENTTTEHSETEGESGATSEQSSAGETGTPSSTGSTSHEEDGRHSLSRLVERSSLEQQHRALLLLRRQLMTRSQRIQQRLSQHFSRKTDDATERVEKNVGELEARYNRYLIGIREQQRFTAEEKERRQQELAAFREQVDQQTELVSDAYNCAVEQRRQVALKSRSGHTGRLMAAAEVEALIGREQQKELEVQETRLESLRRETRLSRLEQTLRESEELAGGIHLIDFEQLKIENQTYAEKIEERNEDLTKLRRKISSTVQILTHLKERIQFEQAENERRQRHLQTVSAEVTHGRESLAQLKQRRDQVRSRTANQRAAAGLLGHEALLRDFEARVDEEARLVRELQTLKRDYADHQRMTHAIQHMVRARKQQQQQQGKAPRSAERQ